MNSILLSTQECGSQELLQLTEMPLQGTGFSDHCFKGVSLYGKGKENKNRRKQGG